MQVLLSFVIAAVIGYSLLGLLAPREEEADSALPALLQVAAGLGVGLGLTSLFFFLWCVVTGSSGRGHIALDVVAALALGLGLRAWTMHSTPRARTPLRREQWRIPLAFAVVCLAALGPFMQRILLAPDGNWDAWAIWNLRARFLFLGDRQWANAFSPLLGGWTHLDYPLLIPSLVARGWNYLGTDSASVPVLIALCCLLGVACTVYSALTRVRAPLLGLLAAGMLLLTPFFVKVSAWLYADVPLAWYFTIAVVFGFLYDLARENNHPAHHGTLVIAGLALGCALWTKNDGWLFVLCYLAVRGVFALAAKRGKAGLTETGYLLLGLLPFLLTAIYFKHAFPAENDIFAGQSAGEMLAKLGDPSRYGMIIGQWLNYVVIMANWHYMHLLLAAALVIFGINLSGRRVAFLTPLLTILLTMVGYFAIYLITPHDLAWHLNTSLLRLFTQLYPVTLFTLFAVARVPGVGSGFRIQGTG